MEEDLISLWGPSGQELEPVSGYYINTDFGSA